MKTPTPLTDLYKQYKAGTLTDEDMAAHFDTTLAGWKQRVTRWGNRLPVLMRVLDKIAANVITRTEACEILGITDREMNALQLRWSVRRPMQQYVYDDEVVAVKWVIYRVNAADVVRGSIDFDEMAARTELSERQARRWVENVLNEAENTTWKDVKNLGDYKKEQMANRILKFYSLSLDDQTLVINLRKGKVTVREAAIERIQAKFGDSIREIKPELFVD